MFFDNEHYEEHLLSVWSRNLEFAHCHSVYVSISPRTSCVTFLCTLPVPSFLSPLFLSPLFREPVWLSVPGITALGVGIRAVIPSPVGGPLCLSTGFPSFTPLFLSPLLCPMIPLWFCPVIPLWFCPSPLPPNCPSPLPPNCPSPLLPNCPSPLLPTRPSPLLPYYPGFRPGPVPLLGH